MATHRRYQNAKVHFQLTVHVTDIVFVDSDCVVKSIINQKKIVLFRLVYELNCEVNVSEAQIMLKKLCLIIYSICRIARKLKLPATF